MRTRLRFEKAKKSDAVQLSPVDRKAGGRLPRRDRRAVLAQKFGKDHAIEIADGHPLLREPPQRDRAYCGPVGSGIGPAGSGGGLGGRRDLA
jgi:hypothetical protein